MSNKHSRLVYSTDQGKITAKTPQETVDKGDGIVRIQRETKGRKGKGVTIISGLGLGKEELKTMAKQLKQHCGTGGAVKDSKIEIQGDQRTAIKLLLENKGFQVKLAGG